MGFILAAGDKYIVKAQGGLAFSEFRGYEGWQTISVTRNERVVAVILGNPATIDAYWEGIPGNGQAFRNGRRWPRSIGRAETERVFADATAPGRLGTSISW
ncbi:MAG TPA: hypothetical protein VKB79_07670 [Bryobacteraceae bacterium]|nr:hypothetical protein [Bryobacteraceae bacterium]